MHNPAPSHGRWRRLLPTVVGVVGLLACVGPLQQQWRAGQWPAGRAADAKPLFLAARAVDLGADPFDPGVLQTLAKQAGMREGGGAGAVRGADPRRRADKGAAYASMYPVSAGMVVSGLQATTWSGFVERFRWWGFGLLVLGAGAAGAAGSGRREYSVLGASGGMLAVLCLAPPLAEGLGVGQANVHIAGLTGLALGALAAGWSGLFAGSVVLGLAIKLMPVGLVAPAVAARSWRAVVLVCVGILALAVAVAQVAPLSVVLADVVESVRYQGAVAPKWVLRDPPRAAFVLYHLRQFPLGLATAALGLAVVLPPRVQVRWPGREWLTGLVAAPAERSDLVAAAALTASWMAVLGAGSQRIYAVLAVPGWAWLLGSTLAPGLGWGRRALALALAPAVAIPLWLDGGVLPDWDGRAVVLLSAWVAWTAVALRVAVHGWAAWGWVRRGTVMGVLVWLAGLGLWWAGRTLHG
jgi:hypothetical protein